jgi:hypothetical protein
MAGMLECPEIVRTDLAEISLACAIMKSYGFWGFGGRKDV